MIYTVDKRLILEELDPILKSSSISGITPNGDNVHKMALANNGINTEDLANAVHVDAKSRAMGINPNNILQMNEHKREMQAKGF